LKKKPFYTFYRITADDASAASGRLQMSVLPRIWLRTANTVVCGRHTLTPILQQIFYAICQTVISTKCEPLSAKFGMPKLSASHDHTATAIIQGHSDRATMVYP